MLSNRFAFGPMLSVVAVGLSVVSWVPSEAAAETHTVQPDSNWCDTINSAAPGDVVEFAPGDYPDTCAIRVSGEPDNRIVVRSADPADPAKLTYDGNSSNVIDLVDGTSYVTLENLYFEPTQQYIDAIKNKAGHHYRIEGCRFRGIGNVSISVNGSSNVNRRAIEIVDNEFIDLEGTGVYIGCHDGSTCQVDDVLFEGNLIKNVDAPEGSVGYGIEIKKNSVATIRDNAIYNTKGPSVTVYGSDAGKDPSIIEGNVVAGSRTDSSILVAGGPAIVRNNVAWGGALASIGSQDYWGDASMQSGIVIVHNTVLPSDNAAISVENWSSGSGNVIAHNAILSGSGAGLSPDDPAGTVRDNVMCESASACFVGGGEVPYDLWPVEGGPLHDAIDDTSTDWIPGTDFMGIERTTPLDVGAFERTDRTFDREVGDGEPRPPRVESDGNGGDDTGPSGGDTGPAPGDAGMEDGGAPDTGTGDTGSGDVPPDSDSDGNLDAGSSGAETGPGPSDSGGGCSCSNTGGSPALPTSLLLSLIGVLVLRRGPRE